ncbi:CD209 antigen-like protein B [Mugil cephalus]|uniref:CD209 antigen-like protein B n=1 Tax=Mugil cephalus TaxID=48193 RepID=UPI001FB5DB5A|nr:CD209 antigen-like protein B [Mugil cephalus]
MENSKSEREEEMSFQQSSPQDFSTDSLPPGQGLFADRGGPAFPHHRLVILSLGLLNALLLISAVVIGIYCAKAKDLEVPQSDAAPLTVELNYLRNRSGIIQAKLDAQAKLVKERNNHVELKLQVKQKKALTDTLQRRIETLQIEKTSLQSNKTALEKSCGRCPPGWILLKLSCYYFSRNEMASRKNWSDSRADCLSKKADLLVINSLEEQQLISENFVRQTGGVSWWEGGYWMGLTDVATEGTWVWVNNVTEVSPLYWRSGQPSHSGPLRGNCGAFLHYTDNLKTWFNANCTDTLLNWICEKELKEA